MTSPLAARAAAPTRRPEYGAYARPAAVTAAALRACQSMITLTTLGGAGSLRTFGEDVLEGAGSAWTGCRVSLIHADLSCPARAVRGLPAALASREADRARARN